MRADITQLNVRGCVECAKKIGRANITRAFLSWLSSSAVSAIPASIRAYTVLASPKTRRALSMSPMAATERVVHRRRRFVISSLRARAVRAFHRRRARARTL